MAQRQDHGQEHRHVLLCSLGVGACIWIFDGVAVLAVKTLIGLFTH